MDIGNIIKYRPCGADAGKPPKVRLVTILNRAVTLNSWEIKPSKFDDGNKLGLFAEICGKCHDTGEEWRTTTSSNVVIDQLKEIDKAFAEHPEYPHEVECVMRLEKFLKLFPLKEGN